MSRANFGSEAGRARNQGIQRHIAGGCLRIGAAAAKYPAAIPARSCRAPWERQKATSPWQRRAAAIAAAEPSRGPEQQRTASGEGSGNSAAPPGGQRRAPLRGQTPRPGPPTTEPRAAANAAGRPQQERGGTGPPAGKRSAHRRDARPTRAEAQGRGPPPPDRPAPGRGIQNGTGFARPGDGPPGTAHHSGLDEPERNPAHRKQGPGEVWARRGGRRNQAPKAKGSAAPDAPPSGHCCTIERKGRLGLCASALPQGLTASDGCPGAALSAALLERMSPLGRIRDLLSRAPVQHQTRAIARPGSPPGLPGG